MAEIKKEHLTIGVVLWLAYVSWVVYSIIKLKKDITAKVANSTDLQAQIKALQANLTDINNQLDKGMLVNKIYQSTSLQPQYSAADGIFYDAHLPPFDDVHVNKVMINPKSIVQNYDVQPLNIPLAVTPQGYEDILSIASSRPISDGNQLIRMQGKIA